jgi:hypothetical protein
MDPEDPNHINCKFHGSTKKLGKAAKNTIKLQSGWEQLPSLYPTTAHTVI